MAFLNLPINLYIRKFFVFFFLTFFSYIQKCLKTLAKYYQEKKGKTTSKLVKDIKIFLRKKRKVKTTMWSWTYKDLSEDEIQKFYSGPWCFKFHWKWPNGYTISSPCLLGGDTKKWFLTNWGQDNNTQNVHEHSKVWK